MPIPRHTLARVALKLVIATRRRAAEFVTSVGTVWAAVAPPPSVYADSGSDAFELERRAAVPAVGATEDATALAQEPG